jgi:hypothetical protein
VAAFYQKYFMMKKWAFVFYLAMLAASCNSILSSKPSGTLSESEMVKLLVDIHLTEATLRISNDTLNRLNDTAYIRIQYAQVFRKNDITPDAFNKSLNYYLQHIETLDKIYTEVISKLSAMEAELQQKALPAFNNFNKNKEIVPNYAQLRNPWFKTLYKPLKPVELHYFSLTIYPDTKEK